MRMPGFTAEASLYKTSEAYQLGATWIEAAGGQGVIPQQVVDFAPPICGPCVAGRQICCYGIGLPCFVRRCRVTF